MKIFAILFFILFFPFKLFASPLACPVCAVAIAGGLGISRMLGVSDAVIGIWVGAALFALSQWTVYFFEKKNIKNVIVKILCYVCWYAMIIPLYLGKEPSIIFNLNTILGIDEFLLSVAIGTLTLFASAKLYRYMKNKNSGKPHFSFEKVALPISSLFIVSLILFFITK